MTTRKNNNAKKSTRTQEVNNAKKGLKSIAHTFNSTARALREPANTEQGKLALEYMNTLGCHLTSLKALEARDIFTAWIGCYDSKTGEHSGLYDEKGRVQMFKSAPYLVEVGGKSYTLYTGKVVDGRMAYTRVSVYTKRTLLSETEKDFDKKVFVSPTVDNVVDGLAQCALYSEWLKKVAKAQARAEKITAGYINMGTSQSPEWVKVARNKKNTWAKVLVKAAA